MGKNLYQTDRFYTPLQLFFKKHYRFILQLAVLSAIASIFSLTDGWLGLKSTLLGGASWMAPSIYAKIRSRKFTMIFDIQKMLKWFLMNQALKLFLSFAMIVLIMSLFIVSKKSFLISYAAMIFTSFHGMMPRMKTMQTMQPKNFTSGGRVVDHE